MKRTNSPPPSIPGSRAVDAFRQSSEPMAKATLGNFFTGAYTTASETEHHKSLPQITSGVLVPANRSQNLHSLPTLDGASQPAPNPSQNSTQKLTVPPSADKLGSSDFMDENNEMFVEETVRVGAARRPGSPASSPYPPSLEFAYPSGRPYRSWEEAGRTEPTFGALIPDGYTKSSDPERPFCCPVVSCSFHGISMKNLGNHFNVAHCATYLNDNLDGTLTQVRSYKDVGRTITSKSGKVGKPAIVVSQQGSDVPSLTSLDLISLQQPRGDVGNRTKKRSHDQVCSHSQAGAVHHQSPDSDGDIPPAATSSRVLLDDCLYTIWTHPSGNRSDTNGALLPREYRPDDTVPGRPWICPLRSCRRTHTSLWQLRRHFKALHGQCLLNDNGDGTLSIAKPGTYSTYERLPAVVSAEPLDPTETPMLCPQISVYSDSKTPTWKDFVQPTTTMFHMSGTSLESRQTSVSGRSLEPNNTPPISSRDTSRPVAEAQIKAEDVTNEVFNIVSPFISRSLFNAQATPQEEKIKGILGILLGLPYARQLDWNPEFKVPGLFREEREIIAIIVQVVGEESARQCTGCRRNTVPGPWLGCVFVPLEATRENIPNKWSCANCMFLGRGNLTCSTAKLSKERLERRGPAPAPALAPVPAPAPTPAPVTGPTSERHADRPLTRAKQPLDNDVVIVKSIVREIPGQRAPSEHQDAPTMAMPTTQDMPNPIQLYRGEEYVAPRSVDARLDAIESLLANIKGKSSSNKKRRRESSEEKDDDEGGDSSSQDISEEESSTSEEESSEEDEASSKKKLLSEMGKLSRKSLEKMMARRKKKKVSMRGKEKKKGKPEAKRAKVARKKKKDTKKTKKNRKH